MHNHRNPRGERAPYGKEVRGKFSMWISNTLARILELMRVHNEDRRQKIIIPYGRHSYGPQPKIVGVKPWALQKARGSKVGNFCSIAPNLKFTFLGKHNYNWVSAYPFYEFYDKWQADVPLYQRVRS